MDLDVSTREEGGRVVVVAIGEMQEGRVPQDVFSVAWDDCAGMQQAVQHLTDLGHR